MGRVEPMTGDGVDRAWHDAATMEEGTVGGVALQWASATDVGRVRSVNEDSLLAAPPVFVVADGMGGHEAGDVASRLVVEEFSGLVDGGPLDRQQASNCLELANRAIVEHGRRNVELQGMGTTAVGLMLVEHGDRASWLLFNVGDSRAYRLCGGVLEQLSVDHSYVQELVDHGQITRAAAREHPQRNVVTRALGVDGGVDADLWLRTPAVGERWLLCSDGLSGEVDDDEIADVLTSEVTVGKAAASLIERALGAGGHDNVTVIVIDVVSVPETAGVDEDTAPRGLIRSSAELGGSSGDEEESPVGATAGELIASDEVLAVVASGADDGGATDDGGISDGGISDGGIGDGSERAAIIDEVPVATKRRRRTRGRSDDEGGPRRRPEVEEDDDG